MVATSAQDREGRARLSRAIGDYVLEIERHLNVQLESSPNAIEVVHGLPAPEVLVQQALKSDSTVEESGYAIADTALVDAVGPSRSIGRLRAELGGVSYQAVRQRVERGTLLSLPTSGGATVFPIVQFVRESDKLKVKSSLQKMFKKPLAQDPWEVSVLLNTPAPELDGESPVEWKKSGGEMHRLEQLAVSLMHELERI